MERCEAEREKKRQKWGERKKQTIVDTSKYKCSYTSVPQQRRMFGQLQCTNTKLSMFCTNSP